MGSDHIHILEKRNRELAILNAIAQSLNAEVDLGQALHNTLVQVVELFDLTTGWIFLLHEETNESYLAASQNLPPALRENPHKMEGGCYCLDTYHAGDLDDAANVNVITCSRLSGLVDGTDGLRYHSSVPIYAHGKKVGLINVASADWTRLSEDDLQLLYTVGDMLGIAIERARLFGQSTEFGAAEERNRLAREIHDTLAQGFSAITLQLETAQALLESKPDAAQGAIDSALELSRTNLEEARRSVLDLRAAPLENRSLAEALKDLKHNLEQNGASEIKFTSIGANHPLPTRVESGLYRIAQEALNNALEHAQANSIQMVLKIKPDRVMLIVADDGVGFEMETVPETSYGLIGLNERTKLLGGTLDIQTTPGEGTRLEVNLPLES
ncbi:MAG: GAF domain-containing protein [Chloroflexi bacterium]|nr:MAG: GAF domain-containing protein [Chloroflexota bacterium]MBL1193640.1 GAF domain-containing protein [Chloroflexota bacterium]NOH10932.1 GAF domain-containing sensor histidine kinase [Chloroflexota bacterium]